MGLGHRAGVDARIGVEQRAMPRRREQAAVVVLAVDLDQMAADLAQQRSRAGLIVQKGAAAAIGLQHAADQQRLTGFERDLVFGEQSGQRRSEENTSELQSLMRISYTASCVK